ncbi:MAG: hypothetical protein ABJN65_08085 [Parasphingorhabdus sp.]
MSVTEMTRTKDNGLTMWIGVKKVSSAKQTVQFNHGLDRAPLIVQVQFSKDDQFDDISIIQWPWVKTHSGGPVSISADTKSVKLHFTSQHVFGSWDPQADWNRYNEGYFRVIAL